MTVRVERCWSGGNKFSFRLTFPEGKREHIVGYQWSRRVASEALDIAQHLYGARRQNVRFKHV